MARFCYRRSGARRLRRRGIVYETCRDPREAIPGSLHSSRCGYRCTDERGGENCRGKAADGPPGDIAIDVAPYSWIGANGSGGSRGSSCTKGQKPRGRSDRIRMTRKKSSSNSRWRSSVIPTRRLRGQSRRSTTIPLKRSLKFAMTPMGLSLVRKKPKIDRTLIGKARKKNDDARRTRARPANTLKWKGQERNGQ